MEKFAFAYLDDIIVIGATEDQHLANLGEVFRRLRRANLKVNPKKCAFFRRRLVYLGHVISAEGVQTDPEKVTAITNLNSPTCLKELRQWLGMTSWYRRFVPNFATMVQEEERPEVGMGSRATERAKRGEKKVNHRPVLGCPDHDKTFVLQTDASDVGLGAVLSQDIEGQERVIAYARRRLTTTEGNYTTTEKECLAIIWAIRKMRCYLEGYRFEVVTDHLALKWLNSIESLSGRVARWALELQQFQFDVRYRRGKLNVVADALSRQPCEVLQQMAEVETPCKWIQGMQVKIREYPEKFSDYMMENGQLYRNLGHRANDEDYFPWKLCVPSSSRVRVLQE